MGLESLLTSLECAVTDVTTVHDNTNGPFGCNVLPPRAVTDVTLSHPTAGFVTAVTAENGPGVTAKVPSTEGRTFVTSVTVENIDCHVEEAKPALETIALPVWCNASCLALEEITGHGPGCVQSLPTGPWHEEWRRLASMTACPKLARRAL